MRYTKPFLTVEDQLEKLKSRGLLVSDDERAKAYLRRIGYYRLSGYWYPLREAVEVFDGRRTQTVVGDKFKPGVEFGQIVDLYVFDKKLRLTMLDAIERVEIGVRTSIVFHVGRYHPWAHRDPSLLDGTFARRLDPRSGRIPHRGWLDKLDDSAARSNEQFAKHFKSKYPNDEMPTWIACELWDFGMLSRFFSGMRYTDRKVIAVEYGLDDPDVLAAWLRAINYLRNVCAHHSRLWNRALVRQPAFPSAGAVPVLDHLVGDNHRQTRLYGTAAAVRFLLSRVNPSTRWPERLKAILDTLPHSPHLQLVHTGFFPGWHELDLWKVHTGAQP